MNNETDCELIVLSTTMEEQQADESKKQQQIKYIDGQREELSSGLIWFSFLWNR